MHRAIQSVGSEPVNIVPLSGPSADLPAKLDLKAMHQSVRWFHIDGEHTSTAVYRELEFANRIVNTDGIVVIDDFFSPRYPANTTEAIRYLEKNPFHFRLLAVGFNKGYLCRPESLPRYMDFMASGMSGALSGYGAKTTIFKTTGPWDTDAVGITDYVDDAGTTTGWTSTSPRRSSAPDADHPRSGGAGHRGRWPRSAGADRPAVPQPGRRFFVSTRGPFTGVGRG